MPTSSRHRFISRQYRLANGVLTLGALSAGLLVLQKLVVHFHDAFLFFYGVSERQFQGFVEVPGFSLSFMQLAIAVIGIVGIAGFIVNERVRSRRIFTWRQRSSITISTPNLRELGSAYVIRVAIFSAVLLLIWILQASFINAHAGLGWGITDGGAEAVLPLVSIFGLCVTVALFVSLVSMLGLRVMNVLECLFIGMLRSFVRARRVPVHAWAPDVVHSLRVLFGFEILSRPPPVAA